MEQKAATELAARLHEQLGARVLRVQAAQVNPLSGDASIGWAAVVTRDDGSRAEVIGNPSSGYQILDRGALGWMPLEQVAKEVWLHPGAEPAAGETSPPADDDLLERLTRVAVGVAEIGAELRAIRDEFTLRRGRR